MACKRSRTFYRPADVFGTRDEPHCRSLGAPVRTHREVANLLGIGRATVYYQEKAALARIHAAFEAAGIGSIQSLGEAPPQVFERVITFLAKNAPQSAHAEPFAAQHGWIRVDRILSINDGSNSATDVRMAYQFLKPRHERLLRPPVLVATSHGYDSRYVVQAVDEHEGALRVRCWPARPGVSRSVAPLTELSCTALVESERGSDRGGHFDIPLLVCVIVSHRRPER